MSSKASSATSPIATLSLLGQSDPSEDSHPGPSPLPSSPLPCWATQALCDLARSETDLRRLKERQTIETESVSRGLERAVMGVHREERRLLERVEQDQRDAQQRLEQLRRENGAATRVAQSLLDQRLHRVAQLRHRVQQSGAEAMRTDGLSDTNPLRDELLKSVAELLQPWEISLSLKRVSFKPSSQPKPISFGEINVQEHNLSFPVGGCGAQGQLCALHASGGHYGEQGVSAQDGRSTPDGAGSGQGQGQVGGTSSGSGNLRVVRKLRLSMRSDEESGEETKRLSSRSQQWPPKRDSSERDSSQDEEQESPTSDSRGDCLFLAVPNLVGNGDSEGEELGNGRTGKMHRHNVRDKRSQLSHREASPFLEQGSVGKEGWYFRSFEASDSNRGRRKGRQDSPRSLSRFGYGSSPSPRGSPRDPLSSHSCMDLSSRDRPRSRLSACSDDHPHGMYGETGGRASSPTDSVDSGYTFIISSPRDFASSVRQDSRLSKSTVDLSHRSRPLINGSQGENAGSWKVHRSRFSSSSASPSLGRGLRRTAGRAFSCTATKVPGSQPPQQYKGQRHQSRVSRSLSMSVIDGSSQDGLGFPSGPGSSQSKERSWSREGKNEPTLVEELEEEGEPVAQGEARLVRQFGKQGSGRADLTLPSGIQATPQGQLFLVDCGNARVQVMDAVGNVMQQVKSTGNGSGARRCRNYFDVAVNSKGLIALSCAAERALLVFSRHGRLLQSFGGNPAPGTAASADGLEAPRGVAVTNQDEFLVADIRKGTLTAMKLDPKTGSRLERTVVTGFHRPYLVAASQHSDLLAVSERGNETGREPCVKVLDAGWTTVRVLGVCSGMGPVLASPWGICIDHDGAVLVADWAEQHRVVLYPAQGVGRTVVSRGLSSPRGLTLLPDGSLVVSDSMHHCVKIFQYK